MNIRPIDLPQVRNEVVNWLGTGRLSLPWLRACFSRLRSESEIEDLRLATWSHLIEAELFYVAPDMVELAEAASATLPVFVPEPFDLPAEQGFMVFGAPVEVPDWHKAGAVSWCVYPDDCLIHFMLYSDYREKLPSFSTPLAPDTMLTCGYGVELGQPQMPTDWSTSDWFIRFMQSAWLLMQQTLAVEEKPELDRAARKRLARAGQDPAPVRVIKLRRSAHGTTTGISDREYRHQWIVRGHWRQQWYPSREVHRPVWIAPHIKGPEGAPMLGGEKVYAWTK